MKISQRLATMVAACLMFAGLADAQQPAAMQMMPGYGSPMMTPMMFTGAAGYTPHGMPLPTMMPVSHLEPEAEYDGEYAGEGVEDCLDCGDGECGECANCGALCASHWFDFHVEYVQWEREEGSRYIAFSEQGPGTTVLDTNSVDFNGDTVPGIRLTGSFVFTPGFDLEVSYLGMIEKFESSAFVDRTGFDDLFSPYSSFGTAPPAGFEEADNAQFHSVDYSSQLHSGEVNFRRRWAKPKNHFQGSWLWGFRYLHLGEEFRFQSNTIVPASLDHHLETVNDMLGFQLGGDYYYCLTPGVLVGAEAEAGVYLNRINNQSVINASTVPNLIEEEVTDHDVSLVAEASLITIVQLTRRCRFRGSYQVMYLDGVGLATENANFSRSHSGGGAGGTTPFTANPEFVNDNGKLLLQAYTGGLEFVW